MVAMARGIVQGVKDNYFPTLSFFFFIVKFLITLSPRVFLLVLDWRQECLFTEILFLTGFYFLNSLFLKSIAYCLANSRADESIVIKKKDSSYSRLRGNLNFFLYYYSGTISYYILIVVLNFKNIRFCF
jgi:predicted membrane protein